jgi:arsenical pump membrane protein
VPQAAAEALAALALLAAIGAAMAGARRVPEAMIAVPLAAMLILAGAVSWSQASDEIGQLGPTVGFLAAILLLAHLAASEGVFSYVGSLVASRAGRRPVRLLGLVFLVASVTTALLSLDATVVLLTPIVFATASAARLAQRPHTYACAHLANSASLLLPVSNLTNLLGFHRTGLSFFRFGGLMGFSWLAVIVVEYVAFRWFFRRDLSAPPPGGAPAPQRIQPPVFALAITGLTLVGFELCSLAGVAPVWAAAAGAVTLGLRRLAARRTSFAELARETHPLFCVFVLALGVIVAALRVNGLGELLEHLPDDPTLSSLLVTAVVAAVLANLVNNLPAILLLLPALGAPALVLAALIGVNVGPNLSYAGSLSNLLWRRSLRRLDAPPSPADFHRLGALVTPIAVPAAVLALWCAVQVIGVS